MDDRGFFPLADVHNLKQATITLAQVKDIVKDFVDEVINLAWTNDWGAGDTKWSNEELTETMRTLSCT
jgi:hypothetical protein